MKGHKVTEPDVVGNAALVGERSRQDLKLPICLTSAPAWRQRCTPLIPTGSYVTVFSPYPAGATWEDQLGLLTRFGQKKNQKNKTMQPTKQSSCVVMCSMTAKEKNGGPHPNMNHQGFLFRFVLSCTEQPGSVQEGNLFIFW